MAPVINLLARETTDSTIDLAWVGSAVLTDILVTYTPSSPGGEIISEASEMCTVFNTKGYVWFLPVTFTGVQLELRIPGNSTTCRISGLEAGLEYNVNVFAVINNSISVPNSITVLTCKCIGTSGFSLGANLYSNDLRPRLMQQRNFTSEKTKHKTPKQVAHSVCHADVHSLCCSQFPVSVNRVRTLPASLCQMVAILIVTPA